MRLLQKCVRQARPGLRAVALSATLIAAMPLPADAGESYPDIVGTWTGLGLDVRLAAEGAGPVFSSENVTQVITEQRDRRFTGTMRSGTKASEQFEVTFVGVFVDRDRFRWSEPNGFLEGRLIDADTIESCYVRTAADHQNAACQTLKRRK